MTVVKRADDSQIRFGPYCLVASQRLLTKDGVPVPLGGRALDILICLTDRAGEVVPAGDLMRLVWQDVRAASATVTLLQKLATLPDKLFTAAFRQQYGALCFRRTEGAIEILVITSRDSGRLFIPKGWPMKRKKPYEAAAIETWEEAGIRDSVCKAGRPLRLSQGSG